MLIKNCRVCKNEFFGEALLKYKNMPRVAQFLPDAKSIRKDKGVSLEVCQCSGCGLIQLNNEPVAYYKDVIRAAGFSKEMGSFRKKQFNIFVKDFSLNGKKIIEIGCGRGEYLSIMHQLKVDAYGLEHLSSSVENCCKNGLKVSQGFIKSSSQKLKNSPFDAFFMLNFLEHLPDPNLTLMGVHNNLINGAVGLVEVPNFDMIFRKNLFSEFTSDHLLYFTKKTLNSTLELNGFEVIDSNEVWHNYIISSVVRKRKKIDITHFYIRQKKLKDEIEKYVGRFENKKLAIWGAGHQALTIIALLNLSGKIRYVIDSAPFKQGKYTPATHIRIVSSDKIKSDPVDAIIVVAASYSDEVAKFIRQKYGAEIKIAILRDFGLEIVK